MDTVDLQNLLDAASARVHELAAEGGHLPAMDSLKVSEAIRALVWSESKRDSMTFRSMRYVPEGLISAALQDSAARVVVAAWLFERATAAVEDSRIAGYMDEATGESERDYFEDHRDEILEMSLQPLQKFLAQRPVESIPPDALLWELHAAGLAQYPSRVVSICDRLVSVDGGPESLATASRAAFLAIQGAGILENPEGLPVPVWWDPESADVVSIGGLFTILPASRAAHELADRLQRSPVSRGRQPQTAAVLKVRHWLELLKRVRALASEEEHLYSWTGMLLGIEGDKGAALSAAQHFEAESGQPLPDLWRALYLQAAAACFLIAGRPELAERPLTARMQIASDQAEAALQLVQCYYVQDKERELLDAFEEYVRLKGESDGLHDFTASLALKLGLLARTRANTADLIAHAAMASPTRAQGEALARWMEPFYADLSDEARRRWWTSLHTLSLPDNTRLLGDDLWTQVAENFAEAVNMELKRRVIRPFIKANERAVLEEARRQDCPSERRRVLNGQGALGQNLLLLKASAYPANSVETLLDDDLARRNQALKSYLSQTNNRKRLERLVELRNQAAHDAVTEVEARETYQLAREIMGVVVRRS